MNPSRQPVTVVDHRRLDGFAPPPRTHTERFRTDRERSAYVRALLTMPGRVESAGDGVFHVHEAVVTALPTERTA